MALTNAEFHDYIRFLRRDATGKEELKHVGTSMNNVRAAVDALDSDYEGRRLALKSIMDTALGITSTNAFAKKLGKGYYLWKMGGE